jgi:simple sugar transport system substrate-binding protein
MRIRNKAAASVAVVLGMALTLSACSSTGGAKATETTSAPAPAPAASAPAGSAPAGATVAAAAGGAVAPTGSYTIAMITHETPGDTFWDKIRSGAQAAAKKDGITLKYSNDPDATKQAALIQTAVSSKVDGIATTLATPDALKASVQSAIAAKIPVVAFNSGINQYQAVGAMEYFGSDEDLAGNTVGKRITAEGGKHPLCVIQAQGSVALEARCAGVKASAPGTENLQVNGADDSSVKSTIQAKLAQDPSIDYVVTLGAPVALDAVTSVKAAGSKAKIITFDLNASAAKDIQSGAIAFSVDQQPYLQGYEAVDSLWLYLTNGNVLGGGKPVLTGPAIVDSQNIAQIAKFAAAGTR